ncbi:MAG: hypothetical protein ACYDH9_07740 [Limisphaerales bacterium]
MTSKDFWFGAALWTATLTRASAAALDLPDRWVYCPVNLLVDQSVDLERFAQVVEEFRTPARE